MTTLASSQSLFLNTGGNGDGSGGGSSTPVPRATSNVYGTVKFDNETIKLNSENQLSVDFSELESSFTKQELVYTNLTPGTSVEIEFTPSNSSDFVELVFSNTIKVIPSEYSIREKVTGDKTQGYILTLNRNITSSTLVNLVLIHGVGLNANGDTPITPQPSVKNVQIRTTVSAGQSVIPINVAGYDPALNSLILYSNTLKVFGDTYEITSSNTSTSGYQISLTTPITNIENKVFEIVIN